MPKPSTLRHLACAALALPLAAACAHKPALPPDPCGALDDPSSALRRKYAGAEWVVGVGHATGVLTPDEARQKSAASAAAEVASQLLVSVQSTLEINESSSNLTGSSTSVESRSRAEVAATDLPGLKIVETCASPNGLNTTALAALRRDEAREVLGRLLKEDSDTLAAGTERVRGLLASRAVLQALAPTRTLTEAARRWRTNARLAQALGTTVPPSAAATQVDALAAELATHRTASVEREGAAARPEFAVLNEAAGAAVTAARWRVDDASRAALRVKLGVSGCNTQAIPALHGVKVSCVLDAQLVEAGKGDNLRSLQVNFEGIGTNELQATRDAGRKAAKALGKPMEEALAALEAESK